MKIAWFTPFGPQSAIGHYSEAIIDKLAETHSIDVFAPVGEGDLTPRSTRHNLVGLVAGTPAAGVLDQLGAYDALVYNMGDHYYYHHPIYEIARRQPGIVVLHDLYMRDFFYGYCLMHLKDPAEMVRLAEYSHGPECVPHHRDLVAGRRRESIDDPCWLRWPMFKAAIGRCLGVVVHSEYARRRVAEAVPVPVAKLDFPCFGPLRDHLGDFQSPRPHGNSSVNLLTFGIINPNKMVHATIKAIGRSARLRRAVRFTVLGQIAPAYQEQLAELIRKYDLGGVVELRGRLSDEELRVALRQADVAINLRNPYMGESSASLVDALLAGLATVVWDHGFYGEFPDEVVKKISAEHELAGALEQLVRDTEQRRRMGEAARVHALGRFNTASFCERLEQFVQEAQWNMPRLALVDRLSDRLAEIGVVRTDVLIDRLAVQVEELFGEPRERAA